MNKRILIVEDEGHLLRQYSKTLKELGEVMGATNSTDALSLIKEYSFDLLVLDNMLIKDPQFPQNRAGFNILKSVRTVWELDTPAILITGYGRIVDNIDVEAEVSDLGMCIFMEKPFNHEELKKKAKKMMSEIHFGKSKINNAFLWNWMKSREQLRIGDFPTEKPDNLNITEYSSIINELAQKFINHPKDGVFKDLIRDSIYLDWILYLTEKRYRNHFKHQFNVGVFGWYLMDVEVDNGITLRKKILNILNLKGKNWTDDQLNRSWWIASLLHDHAYPIAYLFETAFPMRIFLKNEDNVNKDQMDNILNCYKNIYHSILSSELDTLLVQSWEKDVKKNLMDKVSANLHRLQMDGYRIDENTLDPYDHGVLGAVNLVLRLKKGRDNQIDPVINEALIAIAFHNDEKINNICLENHPIAFLLILCDQLQEWNRVIIRNDECLSEFDSISLNLDNPGGEKLQFPERLKIRFEYENEANLNKTGWNYDLFLKSKRDHIGRLIFPKSFNPKGIDMEVLVLHQLDNCQNPV